MTNLKPCPFCGGKARLAYWAPVSCVVCRKCGATMDGGDSDAESV